ncbi:hypothetical protein [Geoglobus ahangari]
MKKRNVYIGPNSTAGIIVHGKVNEDWEVLLNTYATAYDAINSIMLTRQPGVFDRTTVEELHGRFAVLKMLARRYAPELYNVIEQLEDLSVKHLKGQISDKEFLRRIRGLARRHGLSEDLINYVEAQIQAAEMVRKPAPPKPPDRRGKRPPQPRPVSGILRGLFGVG